MAVGFLGADADGLGADRFLELLTAAGFWLVFFLLIGRFFAAFFLIAFFLIVFFMETPFDDKNREACDHCSRPNLKKQWALIASCLCLAVRKLHQVSVRI